LNILHVDVSVTSLIKKICELSEVLVLNCIQKTPICKINVRKFIERFIALPSIQRERIFLGGDFEISQVK